MDRYRYPMISHSAVAVASTLLVLTQCFPQSRSAQSISPLTSSEKDLVESSRKSIIATGLSDSYFETHFKLVNVLDREADRRVVWQFQVNEHQTTVVDAIGYYTQGNQRIATHSVGNSLGRTFEITRALTRAMALKKMKSCIGNFAGPVVQYGSVDGVAQLVLSAEAKRRESTSQIERRRERELDAEKSAGNQKKETDVIESEEDNKHPVVVLGTINLVTGKCTKGGGLVAP